MSRPPAPGPWDPFREIRREVGRLFETLDPLAALGMLRPFPPMNLYEAEGHYILTAEVPGVDPEALDLSIVGEVLTLRGRRDRPEGVREESYRRQERPFGVWSRTVALPGRIDGERVSAHSAHGILTIVLPRAEEPRPRQIVVVPSLDLDRGRSSSGNDE